MRTALLADLLTKVPSWNPSSLGEDEFVYIDLSSVSSETKSIQKHTRIRGTEAPSRARQLLQNGDVIVSTVRPNLNAVAQVPAHLDGATGSTGFTVLRPTGQLDARFLYHWVRSRPFVAEMARRATGASYPAVSDKIVKESRIPLPPLDEQQRIAALLDDAEVLLLKLREARTQLDTLVSARFQQLFGQIEFPTVALRELVATDDRVNYGVVQPGDHMEAGIPIIRVSDIRDGTIDQAGLKRIDPLIESKYARSRIRGNEVLVSCVGSIGNVAIVSTSDIGSNIARAICRVPIESEVSRIYVAEYLRSDRAQHYFTSELRTVAQPTLNVKQLSATRVPLPPFDQQAVFAREYELMRTIRDRAGQAESKAQDFFESIQSRAFRGEL